MEDQRKTKSQLVEEVAELRSRLAALEAAQTASRDKAQQTALLLEAIPLGVHTCDTEGRVLFANSTQKQITGYSADELVGTHIWDRMEPGPQKDSLPTYLKHLVEAQPPPVPYVCKNIKKSGEPYHIRVDWNYERDPQGRVTGFVCIVSDVTLQLKAETALRQSEQRYRRLAESTSDIVYILDHEGMLLYANRSAAACFGCAPEHLVGRRQEDLFPAATAQQHLERIRRVFDTGEPAEMDAKYPFGDDIIWLNVRSIPLRDEQGNVVSVMGVCRNITDRKRAEQSLKRSHDELDEEVKRRTAELARSNEDLAIFRRFAEASAQGFGIADLDGRLVYLNPALCRMYGVEKPDDAVGKHLLTYYPEEYAQQRQDEVLPALSEQGHWEGELEIQPRVESPVPTLHDSFLIRDEKNEPAYLATVVTDIRERKQAREALRQSHDQLKAIYDGTADGLLIADVETKQFVRTNASMCDMLGLSEAELLNLTVMDIHPPQALDMVLDHFSAMIEGRLPGAEDLPVLRKDGSVFYADIKASSITYDGRSCLMGFFRDITERRQAREVLEREHRVLRQMLKAQDRERQLIAYEIHDELAQELTGAIMQFQAFSQKRAPDSPDALKTYDAGIEMLKRALAEARRLISGLRPPILDESGIIAAIGHLIHEVRERGGPEVEFHCRAEFDRLEPTLENALYRIVQEGLTNACRHAGCDCVKIRLHQAGQRVRIEVADDGVGFDPAAVSGDCYGLEGIRERARVLGGNSSIDSVLGKGACVVVDLPIVPAS